MQTFELTRRLPSCRIDKDVLVLLEAYVLEQAQQVFGLSETEARAKYNVVIEEAIGTERLMSARDYRSEKFPDSTISIRLGLDHWRPRVKLDLHFHRDRDYSRLQAESEGAESRGKTIAFNDGLQRLLESRVSVAWFLHPHTLAKALLFGLMVSTLGLFPIAFITPHAGIVSASFVAAPLLLVTYHVAGLLKPYTAFASRRTELCERALGWFVAGMAGFALFGTLLAGLRKKLLGF